MGNALTNHGGPAALVTNTQLLLAAAPARCPVCGDSLEEQVDHHARALIDARHRAAYRAEPMPASHYTPGMRVHLWDSSCLAVVVAVRGDQVEVDDLHVDPVMGHPFRGMVYPASQLRPEAAS